MSIDIGYKDPSGVWTKIGTVPIPLTPTPPPPTTSYDDFSIGAPYTLTPGQTSPNGKWKCIYGAASTVGFMNLLPQAARNPSETHSALVATTKTFKDFDLALDVQTIKQLRTGSAPNNWETAWILWNRPLDDFHLYGAVLKIHGWQVEKKDNFTQNDAGEIYLQTSTSTSTKVGVWQHWRIKVTGTCSGTPTISFWVDGALLTSFIDNKSQANSSVMLQGGPILLYCEDSSTGFKNINIVAL